MSPSSFAVFTILSVWLLSVQGIWPPTPVSHGSVFRRMGNVHPGLIYGHIHIPVDLRALSARKKGLEAINSTLQDYLRHVKLNHGDQHHQSRVTWLANYANSQIKAAVGEIDDVLGSFKLDVQPTREKRQLLIATGLAFVVGGFVSYAVQALHQNALLDVVENKQNVFASTIEHEMVLLHQANKDIKAINTTLIHLVD